MVLSPTIEHAIELTPRPGAGLILGVPNKVEIQNESTIVEPASLSHQLSS